MISMATKYKNVYIDTSAYTPERFPESLVRFIKGPGRRKVMFGSNWPMIPPKKCLDQLEALGLDNDTRTAFLYGNAMRVFGLDCA